MTADVFKERRDKWTAALRSGEYGQGQNCLRSVRDDGTPQYCCLGVATEVYRKETGKGQWVSTGPGGATEWEFSTGETVLSCGVEYPDNSWSVLPLTVAEWFGLPGGNPRVTLPEELVGKADGDQVAQLANLNDNCGFTFEELADLIENTPFTDE